MLNGQKYDLSQGLRDAIEDCNDTAHTTTGFRPAAFHKDYTQEKFQIASEKAQKAWETILIEFEPQSKATLVKGHYQIGKTRYPGFSVLNLKKVNHFSVSQFPIQVTVLS